MKFLLTLSFICTYCFVANSQLNPYINNVEILPASPTSADNIKIVTTVTTAYQGMLIYSAHSINGNTIEIEACYYSGLLPATQTYYDTLEIGMLPSGSYGLDFTAYQSSDTICNYTDSSATSIGFTVAEDTSDVPSNVTEIVKLYPNPNSGTFFIDLPNHLNATHVRIKSLSGENVHQGEFKQMMSLDIQSGMYFIEFLQGETILGYQRLLVN